MDQIHLDPQDKLPPHPPPLGHIVNKTPSTHRTKKCLRPTPPEDNFLNSPNAHGLGLHVSTGLDSSVSMNPQIHMLWIRLGQRGIPSPKGVIKFRHCSKDWKLTVRMFIL